MNKRWIFKILVFFCFYLCWSLVICQMTKLKEQDCAIQVQYNGEGVQAEQLRSAKDELVAQAGGKIESVLFTGAGDGVLYNIFQNTESTVSVLYVNGTVSMLYPYQLMDGIMLDEADSGSCLIDYETAFALFGTKQASGYTVQYQDKEYKICGVIDTKETLFVVNNKDASTYYQFMLMEIQDKESAVAWEGKKDKDIIADFIAQYNLGKPSVVLSEQQMVGFAEALEKLPVWCIFIWIIVKEVDKLCGTARQKWRCYKQVSVLDRNQVLGKGILKLIISVAITLVYLCCYWKMCELKLQYPQELVPGKWSDFEFYVNLISEYVEEVQIAFNSSVYLKMLLFKTSLIYMVVLMAFTTGLLAFMMFYLRLKGRKSLIRSWKEAGTVVVAALLCGCIGYQSFHFILPFSCLAALFLWGDWTEYIFKWRK